ncbi:MAG: hydrogenase, partial [Deferribacteres bacterium]|nr:hydrogenase [Deferribacteres bacterium]
MIFRVFEKEELKQLFDILSDHNRVVGPVEAGRDKNGRPVYAFSDVHEFNDIRLNHTVTKLPAKRYFLPFREDLATFKIENDQWQKNIAYNIEQPFILFGLHPCDINALNKLDKVLLHSVYPMPYYAAKRKNMFIIGFDCIPQPYCFCRSMGADTALHGFDMFITDLGTRYFVEILTDTAYNFLRHIRTEEPREDDHVLYMKVVAERNEKFTAHVDTTDLAKILDMEFQSDVWKYWG